MTVIIFETRKLIRQFCWNFLIIKKNKKKNSGIANVMHRTLYIYVGIKS